MLKAADADAVAGAMGNHHILLGQQGREIPERDAGTDPGAAGLLRRAMLNPDLP